jgi:hypothetical protein
LHTLAVAAAASGGGASSGGSGSGNSGSGSARAVGNQQRQQQQQQGFGTALPLEGWLPTDPRRPMRGRIMRLRDGDGCGDVAISVSAVADEVLGRRGPVGVQRGLRDALSAAGVDVLPYKQRAAIGSSGNTVAVVCIRCGFSLLFVVVCVFLFVFCR